MNPNSSARDHKYKFGTIKDQIEINQETLKKIENF